MSRVSAATGPDCAARAACNAGGYCQGAQQCTPGLCADKIAGSDFGRRRGRRPAGRRAGCPNQTQPGSAFAGGLLCRSSLEWNNHTTLLASRSPTRKGRFATTDIIETASRLDGGVARFRSSGKFDDPVRRHPGHRRSGMVCTLPDIARHSGKYSGGDSRPIRN